MIEARTIMSENVITTTPQASIQQAAKLMLDKHVSTLLVTENGLPIASIGKKELVQVSLKKNARMVKVGNIMNTNFAIITPDTSYARVEQIVRTHENKRCPVVEDNRLVGIVTQSDVMSTAREFTRNERIKQDLTLVVFGIVTAVFLFLYSPIGHKVLGLS